MDLALDTVLEIVLRVSLCGVFVYIEQQQPFIRHIEEEELWMYRYPSVDSYVPKLYLYFLIITIPTVVFCIEYIVTKKKEAFMNNLLALSLAYVINAVFTSILKTFVGRPRPNFFYRCFPDGVGMDISNCTGDYKAVMDARRSFPSGHSSFVFTGMFFITQHLCNLMDLKNAKTGKGYKMVVAILPMIIAVIIAISRTCDYHHHYSDVLSGAVLGMAVSYAVYSSYYQSVEEENMKE